MCANVSRKGHYDDCWLSIFNWYLFHPLPLLPQGQHKFTFAKIKREKYFKSEPLCSILHSYVCVCVRERLQFMHTIRDKLRGDSSGAALSLEPVPHVSSLSTWASIHRGDRLWHGQTDGERETPAESVGGKLVVGGAAFSWVECLLPESPAGEFALPALWCPPSRTDTIWLAGMLLTRECGGGLMLPPTQRGRGGGLSINSASRNH